MAYSKDMSILDTIQKEIVPVYLSGSERMTERVQEAVYETICMKLQIQELEINNRKTPEEQWRSQCENEEDTIGTAACQLQKVAGDFANFQHIEKNVLKTTSPENKPAVKALFRHLKGHNSVWLRDRWEKYVRGQLTENTSHPNHPKIEAAFHSIIESDEYQKITEKNLDYRKTRNSKVENQKYMHRLVGRYKNMLDYGIENIEQQRLVSSIEPLLKHIEFIDNFEQSNYGPRAIFDFLVRREIVLHKSTSQEERQRLISEFTLDERYELLSYCDEVLDRKVTRDEVDETLSKLLKYQENIQDMTKFLFPSLTAEDINEFMDVCRDNKKGSWSEMSGYQKIVYNRLETLGSYIMGDRYDYLLGFGHLLEQEWDKERYAQFIVQDRDTIQNIVTSIIDTAQPHEKQELSIFVKDVVSFDNRIDRL